MSDLNPNKGLTPKLPQAAENKVETKAADVDPTLQSPQKKASKPAPKAETPPVAPKGTRPGKNELVSGAAAQALESVFLANVKLPDQANEKAQLHAQVAKAISNPASHVGNIANFTSALVSGGFLDDADLLDDDKFYESLNAGFEEADVTPNELGSDLKANQKLFAALSHSNTI